MAWQARTQPWVRREANSRNGAGADGKGFVTCYFCGQPTAKLSVGDISADAGRIEVYCDSDRCEAREVVVLVRRDGSSKTQNRADVRVLTAIDEDTPVTGGEARAYSFGELVDGDANLTSGSILARRTSTGPLELNLHSRG